MHFDKKTFTIGTKARIEVDGYCDSPKIYCEVWADIGIPKSAQKNKVMTDALKLHFIRDKNGGDGRCILLLADEKAVKHFRANSWMAECLKYYEIEVMVEKLEPDLEVKVLEAQKRQYR